MCPRGQPIIRVIHTKEERNMNIVERLTKSFEDDANFYFTEEDIEELLTLTHKANLYSRKLKEIAHVRGGFRHGRKCADMASEALEPFLAPEYE